MLSLALMLFSIVLTSVREETAGRFLCILGICARVTVGL